MLSWNPYSRKTNRPSVPLMAESKGEGIRLMTERERERESVKER
jgi:hypothetical protein